MLAPYDAQSLDAIADALFQIVEAPAAQVAVLEYLGRLVFKTIEQIKLEPAVIGGEYELAVGRCVEWARNERVAGYPSIEFVHLPRSCMESTGWRPMLLRITCLQSKNEGRNGVFDVG